MWSSKKAFSFLDKVETLVETLEIHLPFSCKRWTSTGDCQVGVIEKTSTLLKHGDIILNSMSQAKEKWDSLVLGRTNF